MKAQNIDAVMMRITLTEQTLRNHLVALLIERGTLPKEALNAILKTFYADGLWWVPALKRMEKQARNPRFKQALLDNYNCETGNSGNIPHTELMENFAQSIMLNIDMKETLYVEALSRAQKENKMLGKTTEATRAGFMLATETLFPALLQIVRPAIVQQYPYADMQYIDEHIEVDGDQHAIWMRESVEQILAQGGEMFEEVIKGIEEAADGALYPFQAAGVFCSDIELSVHNVKKQTIE